MARSALLAARRRQEGSRPAAAVPRALHRAHRLQRGPARRLDPSAARRRGAPAQRLLHPVRRGRQGPGHRRGRELRCTYDPDSLGKAIRREAQAEAPPSSGCRPPMPCTAEVRLYDRLFTVPNPEEAEEGKTFKDYLNPESVEILRGCAAGAEPGGRAVRRTLPVRAPRLLHRRRRRFAGGCARLQPHRRASGHVQGGTRRKDGSAVGRRREARPAGRRTESAAPSRGAAVPDERARARAGNPSLAARYDAYTRTMGLPPELADVLTGDPAVADFFDSAAAAHPNPRAVANWTANDVLRELKGRSIADLPFSGEELADLVRRVDTGGITTAAAKTVFAEMMSGGGAPGGIIRRLGLDQAVGGADLVGGGRRGAGLDARQGGVVPRAARPACSACSPGR